MTTSQRLAAIIFFLASPLHGPTFAVIGWAADHPTITSLTIAVILARPLLSGHRRPHPRRAAKAPPRAHYSHAA